MSYAIQVQRRQARMVSFDGKESSGELFLHATGVFGGAQTVLERLNDPATTFVPFRSATGLELVNLRWVAYFEMEGLAPEVEQRLEVGACRERVELELVSGGTLRGDVIYERPPESRRVSDLLNSPSERFVLLVTAERTFYVHLQAVVRARF